MARRRANQFTRTAGIVFSALVALSMVLSLLGPLLFRAPQPATPTPAPTWTPWPTHTPTPETEATETAPLPTAAPPPPDEDAPIAGPAGPFRFAVIGDTRKNDEVHKKLLSMIVEDGNEFLINTGDLVEYGSKKNFEAFSELMSRFPLPFYPVPGNHDRDDDGTLTNYLEYSRAPGSHYSFDAEQVHFTMASSSTGSLTDRELQWIADDLDSTELPLKIVVLHHPPFDPDGTSYTLFSGGEAFMKLMEDYQVAYVFAGHIHAYSAEERNGTTYVITGGGGAPLYEEEHPQAIYHYVQVTVNGTEITTELRPLQE